VGLRVWKTIKALSDLSAVFLGFFAIAEGADPLTTMMLVTTVLVGWEVLEVVAVRDELRAALLEATDTTRNNED